MVYILYVENRLKNQVIFDIRIKNQQNTYMDKRYFIYKITNLLNDKIYIGKTRTSIEERWVGHINASRYNKCTMYISRAIKKYGVDNFKIEQIEECMNEQEMKDKESYYILKYKSYLKNIGYNLKTESEECFEFYNLDQLKKKSLISRKRQRLRKFDYGINVKKDKKLFVVNIDNLGIRYFFSTSCNETAKLMADKCSIYFYGKDIPLNFESSKDFSDDEVSNAFLQFKKVKTKEGSSKFNGVSFGCGHWLAKLKFSHFNWFLGFYKTEEEAAQAVDKARFVFKQKNSIYYNFPQEIDKYNLDDLKIWFNKIARKNIPNVSWYKKESKFRVVIKINSKDINFGYYNALESAIEVYDMVIVYYKLDKELYYKEKLSYYEEKSEMFIKNILSRKERNNYLGMVCRNRYGSPRYYVLIDYKGKRYNFGSYSTELDAAKAYDYHVREMNLVGIKPLNFPDEIINVLPDKKITFRKSNKI